MGVIYSIVYQPVDSEHGGGSKDFVRVPVREAILRAGHGIEGDRKAGRHPGRQINLLSREWLLQLRRAGYRIEPGQFGEQIIVSGIDLEELRVSECLQLGATACIEISQARHPCGRLHQVQQLPVDGLKTIGLMGAVITGGTIRVGDPVTVRRHALTETVDGIRYEEVPEVR